MNLQNKKEEMIASNWNMQQLNSEELEEHLDRSFEAGSNIVVIGHRGTGKTSISKQRILSNGMLELYINLSMFERADLMGYAKLFGQDDKDEFIDFKLPRMFQPLLYGDKKVVILFDEADKADSSLNAPLLEILQFHTINGRQLPNLQSCILTGNLISEGGNKLISPLLDRAEKYLLESNAEKWLKWAAKNNIHPSIFTFINDNPQMLCGTDDISDYYADRSPRGWELSSKMMQLGEAKGWSKETMLRQVAGFVGRMAATQYETYYSNYKVLLPLVEKVFDGKSINKEYADLEPSDKLMACIIVGAKFANKLDQLNPKDDFNHDVLKHIGNFMNYAGEENVVAVVRGQIGKRLVTWKLYTHTDWNILNEIRKETYGEKVAN